MTPLERAARAAHAEHNDTSDAHRVAFDPSWDGWKSWLPVIRAVLTAIREPNEPVARAMAEAIERTIPCDSGTDPAEAHIIAEYGVPAAVAAAMIDAMLAEEG